MIKEEIAGGLKAAMARGETLEKAMMSFYNSGYSKQDIEDAAHHLQAPSFTNVNKQQINPLNNQNIVKSQQEIKQPEKKTNIVEEKPIVQEKIKETSSKQKQVVSNYQEKPKKSGMVLTLILVFLFLLLVGALIGFILFREDLIEYLGNIF